MATGCEYCNGAIAEGETRCGNCGAPILGNSANPDFRSCPFCRRKLLALGSPACNYCGRRLPDHYIKAREADLKRITDVKDRDNASEADRKVDELIRQGAGGRSGRGSSLLGIFDLTRLFNFFR